MDFTATPEQQAAADLARGILADRVTLDRQRATETTGCRHDTALFAELGAAGLVGIALPEEYGGAGLSLLELAAVVTEVGRAVAPLPLAWHGTAALTLAEAGTPHQQDAYLPGAATGDLVLAPALSEEHADSPAVPQTTATRSGDSWVLAGAKTAVPSGTVAGLFLVPASTEEGTRVFLVAPTDPGVLVEPQALSDGDASGLLRLDDVSLGPDRLLGQDLTSARLATLVTAGLCAYQLGVTEGALDLTSGYARTRQQFGRPIGSFQAVSQRLADGYIDVLGLRLTTEQALWRLAAGLPADLEVAVAKLWAADVGHRLAHTTVHVHGGVGIDLDGTAHRYFTTATRVGLMLGGATAQALAIGHVLATEPV